VRWLLRDFLALGDDLVEGPRIPASLTTTVAEHGIRLRPDFVLLEPQVDEASRPRLLVCRWPLGTNLDRRPDLDEDGRPNRWAASPIERAATLCRAVGVPLALVTDSDRFVLVFAPRGAASGHGTFVSNLFGEERELLDAFCSLLGARRFFAVADGDSLEALMRESASAQYEVTTQLGIQVREAVELLVAAFSRANRTSGFTLLASTPVSEVYSAAVTVMMRLVVLLSAEERRLLPIEDDLYAASYAVSTLRDQLETRRISDGEDTLLRRSTAWYRLLAAFRAIHGGIQHERLRLPAYGSELFDPDRFPFLEGRRVGGEWRADASQPVGVDDGTVLAILNALQVLTFRDSGVTEARRLSYRGLDVEQIGHVYEGLLDHGCVMSGDTVLGLVGRKGGEPEVSVGMLDNWREAGHTRLLAELADLTGKSLKALSGMLGLKLDPEGLDRLKASCDNDEDVLRRVTPFAGLLRFDPRGLPMVFLPGSIYVTQTSLRRDSGTEYTTKELADEVVQYALEPLLYNPGPGQGADRDAWVPKTSREILDLKVCDPTVGSGAIIVAACRYLADRLVEAWQVEVADGRHPARLEGVHPDDWTLEARRLVVDHCLYGVDRDPMAVQMAKLSLWLTTMAKERPFTFLDHAFRSGDSLLGVTSLDQIAAFDLEPLKGRELHKGRLWDPTEAIESHVALLGDLTGELAEIDVRTVRDAEHKARAHGRITETLAALGVVADLIVGAAVASGSDTGGSYRGRLERVRADVRDAFDSSRPDGDRAVRLDDLRATADFWLDTDRPPRSRARACLHWPLVFPEVFLGHGGFDAVVANPPYMGNKYWRERLGSNMQGFFEHLLRQKLGKPDLVAVFIHRMMTLLRTAGTIGTLATQSVSEVDSKRLIDAVVLPTAQIFRATRSRPWPGNATVVVSVIWLIRSAWGGSCTLDDIAVRRIGADLREAGSGDSEPEVLARHLYAFQGVDNSKGLGFVVPSDHPLVASDSGARFFRPYVSGEDVVQADPRRPARYALDLTGYAQEDLDRLPRPVAGFLDEVVAPTRSAAALKPYAGLAARWWTFWNTREDGFRIARQYESVVVVPSVAKHPVAVRLPSVWTYTNMVIVFAEQSPGIQTLLSSELFEVWFEKWGGSLGEGRRMKLAPVVYTFPLPTAPLAPLAGDHWQAKVFEMLDAGWACVTDVMNGFHDVQEESADIRELRHLQAQVDRAALEAYGWADLFAGRIFIETPRGPRYTSDMSVRTALLGRLVALNRLRHQEDVAKRTSGDTARGNRSRPRTRPQESRGLFE
jgi:hypothetical protein